MRRWWPFSLPLLLVLAIVLLSSAIHDARAAQGPGDPAPVSVGELVYSERGQIVGQVTHVLVERGRTLVLVEARDPRRGR